MSAALQAPSPGRMTTTDFLSWPDDPYGRRQQLVDGELLKMSPVSQTHSLMHGEIAFLLRQHLRSARPDCNVLITPGVPPGLRPEWNVRSPDLAVVCGPPSDEHLVANPVLLVEILSPSNQRQTRANVWAYTTIGSAREILLVSSLEIGAELLRRRADRSWPATPEMLTLGDMVPLDSIGGAFPLVDFYATTSLAVPAP